MARKYIYNKIKGIYIENITHTLELTCVKCGKSFSWDYKQGITPKYCSSYCRDSATIGPADRIPHKCEVCGKDFTGHAVRRFCGRKCSAHAKVIALGHKFRNTQIPCKQCGKLLQPIRDNNAFCSSVCYETYTRPIYTCEICSKQFPKNGGKNRCCSRECGFELQRRERSTSKWTGTPKIHG